MQVSQGEEKPLQTEYTHDNSSTNVSSTFIVLCISNGLICVYITDIRDKRIVASSDICHKQSVFSLSSSILSAGCFAIIYTTDNSQLMLTSYWMSVW